MPGSRSSAPPVASQQQPYDLPRLPGWLPVLRRGPGELQIGVAPYAGLVLAGLPDGVEDVLRLADGRHTRVELRQRAAASGFDPVLVDRILRALSDAGLLSGGRTPPTSLDGLQVRLIGAGALGRAVAGALLDAGVSGLYLADSDPVDPGVYRRPGLATTQAEALYAALRDRWASGSIHADERPAGVAEIRVVAHWTKPEHARPDVTVIASDRAEPDPAIGEDLVRVDHPHLYVRPLHGGAVVGPFVRPGRSPCLRCIDLLRRDADPAWPGLLPQLCRSPLPVAPLLAGWAGVTAVTQLAAGLSGGGADTLAGTLEITAPDCAIRYREWPMHPHCGCAWR